MKQPFTDVRENVWLPTLISKFFMEDRMKRNAISAVAVTMFSLAVAGQAQAVDVLKNGSFESNNATSPTWTNIFHVQGTTNQINNWTFQTDNGKWLIKASNFYNLGSPSHGDFFLNVTGLDQHAQQARFHISQTFAVVSGETYTVYYDLARRPGSDDDVEITIKAGGVENVHTAASLGEGSDNPASYQTFSFQFVAVGGTATIEILGPTLLNDVGFYLDNIRVDGMAVPEPASLALMGLGGMLLMRRRRD